MRAFNKRIVFTLVVIGLFILGLIGWQLFQRAHAPNACAITNNKNQNEQFASQDTSRWPESELDWKLSPVDLSFLNETEKPAGKHGFVKASGESLVFGDGSPARFWGINIAARALFQTSQDNVKLQAKRISALGFNLVRIHHFDSPWVNPNIFGKDASDTQTLDPQSLDKLDWWIKCLKDEGIYIWLDLHVQRGLTEGDHIYGFDEIRKGGEATADLKGYNYINQSIQQAMKRFNKAYLNHINAYTGVAYKNEPAIMALLITNENDVTYHFGDKFLPDKKVPLHNRLFMALANKFAGQTGLPADKVWRAWEPGPAKLFLNDLEHRFNIDMISNLHSLGVKVPIATTSSWGGGLTSLPALTDGDIIDAHAYGEALELNKDPHNMSSMVNWLSMSQVSGKPMTVTEWNVSPFPVPDRHSSPLYIASAARLQGWDAVMLYAYAQAPLNDAATPTNWNAFNDPALLATLPAAALLYRQGHVKESHTVYALAPDREQLFYESISPDNSIAARTASEKGKLVVVMPTISELPWLKIEGIPVGAKVIHDPNQSMIANIATEVLSDTGEIRRDWTKGIYTISTPCTQAAMGWIGNRIIALPDVIFDIKTLNASAAVQSLDGHPIKQSSSLMITLGAQAQPSGDKLPFRSEPVLGRISIHAPKGLKLFKRTVNQGKMEIPVDYRDGRYVINLEATLETSWLFLK